MVGEQPTSGPAKNARQSMWTEVKLVETWNLSFLRKTYLIELDKVGFFVSGCGGMVVLGTGVFFIKVCIFHNNKMRVCLTILCI